MPREWLKEVWPNSWWNHPLWKGDPQAVRAKRNRKRLLARRRKAKGKK